MLEFSRWFRETTSTFIFDSNIVFRCECAWVEWAKIEKCVRENVRAFGHVEFSAGVKCVACILKCM